MSQQVSITPRRNSNNVELYVTDMEGNQHVVFGIIEVDYAKQSYKFSLKPIPGHVLEIENIETIMSLLFKKVRTESKILFDEYFDQLGGRQLELFTDQPDAA